MKGIGSFLPMTLIVVGMLFVAFQPFSIATISGIDVRSGADGDILCVNGELTQDRIYVTNQCGTVSGGNLQDTIRIDNSEFIINSKFEILSKNGVSTIQQATPIVSPIITPISEPVQTQPSPIENIINTLLPAAPQVTTPTASLPQIPSIASSLYLGLAMIAVGGYLLIKKE